MTKHPLTLRNGVAANEEIMLMLMLESENQGQRPRPEIRSHKSEIRSVTIARLRVSGF
jgi:hypothetical protein